MISKISETRLPSRNRDWEGDIFLLLVFIGFIAYLFNSFAIKHVLEDVIQMALRKMPRFGLPIILLACIFITPFFDLLLRNRTMIFGLLFLYSITVTSITHAFAPAHLLPGRIRTNNWGRVDIYEYPALIDKFPKGQGPTAAPAIKRKRHRFHVGRIEF